MAGVRISNSGGSAPNTYSDVDGTYSFQRLTTGQYRIEPRKALYTFSPPYRLVNVPPDATEVNFTAISQPKQWKAFLPTVQREVWRAARPAGSGLGQQPIQIGGDFDQRPVAAISGGE